MVMVKWQEERRIVYCKVNPYNSSIHTYKYFKNQNVDCEALCEATLMIGAAMSRYRLLRTRGCQV